MRSIELQTGLLSVQTNSKLDALVSFGSRINKKRGFFFISKVTGKHLPAKPSRMKSINEALAKRVPKSDAFTLFIGFAEAAVSLGQGVFEAYNAKNSFYIHTTRYKTSKNILVSFEEEHSHAPSHILYEPQDDALKKMLQKVTRIVLVDDEISTGNTVKNFILELKKVLPHVKNYLVLSILDWSQSTEYQVNALYKGDYTFTSNNLHFENNIKSIPSKVNNLDAVIPYNFGRYGVEKLDFPLETYVDIAQFKNKKVLVLGTAEFMYLPYLFASYLEESGIDTYFQSTTRSPINIDGEIVSKISFVDNYHEEIDNFLYNVIDKDYDAIIICYETQNKPANFDLQEQLEKKFQVREIFFSL